LSSVILLGGFIDSLDKLGKMDFWCVTAITVIQAAGSVISLSLCVFFLPSLSYLVRGLLEFINYVSFHVYFNTIKGREVLNLKVF
jgi:hypothetical protein